MFVEYSYDDTFFPPRINELQDQLAGVQDQLHQVSSDLTHFHGERSEKYKELKRREDSMRGLLSYSS